MRVRVHSILVPAGLILMMTLATSEMRANPGDPPRHPRDQAWQVAQGMEGIFVRQMLQAMRQSVPQGGYLEDSSEAKFYRSMLDEEYADIISQRGDLGISTIVYDYLTQDAPHGRNKK